MMSLVLTEARDMRFSVSGIPDTAEHRRKAERKKKKTGALCDASASLGVGGGGRAERRGCWVVSKQARVLGPVHGWNARRPSGGRLDTAL